MPRPRVPTEILDSRGSFIAHPERGGDLRNAFSSSLSDALGESGNIVVYNQQFESQGLSELAAWLS